MTFLVAEEKSRFKDQNGNPKTYKVLHIVRGRSSWAISESQARKITEALSQDISRPEFFRKLFEVTGEEIPEALYPVLT